MTDSVFRPEATLAARLAGVAATGPLADALRMREQAGRHAEASYRVLFETVDGDRLTVPERLAIALATAEAHADTMLTGWYRERLANAGGPPSPTPRFDSALAHARRVATEPVAITAVDLQVLQAAGWSEDAIVTLSQIVAFVSFQSRYVAGLALLSGDRQAPVAGAAVITAGRWHDTPLTRAGRPAPVAFTRDLLDWEPWLSPREPASLGPAEAEQLARAGHLESPYFMLLARDAAVLDHRTRTDKGIFFGQGGLSRAERELAATVTSKINGCIYCASVHARKAAQLSGETAAVDRLLAVPAGADPGVGQSTRWQAQIRLAAQLSATPSSARTGDVAELRAQGSSELELLDLISAVAFFSWANRLMLTLGEPWRPQVDRALAA